MRVAFDEAKVTEAAVRLIVRAGGTLNYMKLIKLLYLADRLALERYGSPITGDRYYSMKQGPVLSQTLDLIKGSDPQGAWGRHVETDRYDVRIRQSLSAEVLCEADLSILDEVFERYGRMGEWQLVEVLHASLPEWKDPEPLPLKRLPIEYADILAALGKTPDETAEILSALHVSALIDNVTARRT